MSAVLANLLIIEAPAGRETELERRLSAFVLRSRQVEGCLSYELFQSLETVTRFMLQIRWRDRESLELHLNSPELQQFLEDSSVLVAASFAVAYRNFLPEVDSQK
ncbi:MAG TPA: antibiotic biosynthesis monooxygenase family protein [bacterium]|nr:antibiotic biosynthesis monooxygenase family protein [bacterium]